MKPQFGKIYWGVKASPAARIIAAYVQYRCYSQANKEIPRKDFQQELGLGHEATDKALKEAVRLGLISRRPSERPGARGVYVYTPGNQTSQDSLVGKPDQSENQTSPETGVDLPRKPGGTPPETRRDTSGNQESHEESVEPKAEPKAEQAEQGRASRGQPASQPGGVRPPVMIETDWDECPTIPIPADSWDKLLLACGLTAEDPHAWSEPVRQFLIERRKRGVITNWAKLIDIIIGDGDLENKGVVLAVGARKGSGTGGKLKVITLADLEARKKARND